MSRFDLVLRIALLVVLVVNLGLVFHNAYLIKVFNAHIRETDSLREKLEKAIAETNAARDMLQKGLDADSNDVDCSKPYPKVVPYHDGMKLCPGQSAVGVIPIPLPFRTPTRDDDEL